MKSPLAGRGSIPGDSVPREVIGMVRRFAMVCGVAAALVALVVVGYPESWNQIPAPDSPRAKYGTSVVVLDDGRVIVYGGEDYRGDLQNTIVGFWNNEWMQLRTTNSPPARLGASLTQVSDHEVALFGGMGENGVLNDLWILDVNTGEWRQVAMKKAPPPRKFHAAFYYDGTLYIAGGVGKDVTPRRDLWRYSVEENAWGQGPDAPEDFWGAYATVSCESPCTAYILGPVSLAYDLAKDEWSRLTAEGDVPPPKYLAAFARVGDVVHMFGGLYTDGKKVYSTSCHFEYGLKNGAWIYHRAAVPPFEKSGLWGAAAFRTGDGSISIFGGLVDWPFGSLGKFLAGGIKIPPSIFNRNIFVWRPGGLAGAGGQPGGAGKPGLPELKLPPRKDWPLYPPEENPILEQCLITDAVDENNEPVSLNPVFTGADDAAIFWFRISPLCDQHSLRADVYDADGAFRTSFTDTTPNPDDYGVDCIRRYTSWRRIPLGAPVGRPHGNWWIEFYIDDVLSCTLTFEVTE